MDTPNKDFVRAGSLEELKAKGRLVVHGRHRPILVIYDRGRVFALDNRCPHMGFPLERGSVEDGILTCHWHHARFDLASGCTFDLWADDVPTCPVEVRNDEVWVKPTFGSCRSRRALASAACGRPRPRPRPRHRQGRAWSARGRRAARPISCGRWRCSGRRTATAGAWASRSSRRSANLLPVLPEEEAYLALFHGARRVAADCDGEAPRRERAPLASRPGPGHAQALAAALDKRAPSRGGRAHPAHRDCGRCLAGCARRCPARGRDRAGVRRQRTLARLHQQGLRVPRPDRLGACGGCAADCRRPDGGGPRRRGIDRLAPAR